MGYGKTLQMARCRLSINKDIESLWYLLLYHAQDFFEYQSFDTMLTVWSNLIHSLSDASTLSFSDSSLSESSLSEFMSPFN